MRAVAVLICVTLSTVLTGVRPCAGAFDKRGLPSGHADRINGVNAAWSYRWWPTPSAGQTEAEFVPMIPSLAEATDTWIARVKALPGVTHLLGFNEPEVESQGNVTVAQAIAAWPKLMSAGLRLGSPAVSDDGDGRAWMQAFMAEIDRLGYRVDFVCFHWYGDVTTANADDAFIGRVNWYHNQFNRPVWVTEFAGFDWNFVQNPPVTPAKNLAFMRKALPRLDALSYVERYAWFSGSLTSVASLFTDDSAPATLSSLGERYQRPLRRPTQIACQAGPPTIPADWESRTTVRAELLDDEGALVGTASDTVTFSIAGEGTWIDGTTAERQVGSTDGVATIEAKSTAVAGSMTVTARVQFEQGDKQDTTVIVTTPDSGGATPFVVSFQQGDLRVNDHPVDEGYGTPSIFLQENAPDWSGSATLGCGSHWVSGGGPGGNGAQYRSLLAFDLSKIPELVGDRSHLLADASLRLECFSQEDEMTHVLSATDPFVAGATWNNPSGDGDGSDETPGGTVGPELGRVWIKSQLGTRTWLSHPAFVSAVSNALARPDKTLYLLLKEAWASNQDALGTHRTPEYATVEDRPELIVQFKSFDRVPEIRSFHVGVGGTVSLDWSDVGRPCTVQWATNLIDPTWFPAQGTWPAETNRWSGTAPVGGGPVFHRVISGD